MSENNTKIWQSFIKFMDEIPISGSYDFIWGPELKYDANPTGINTVKFGCVHKREDNNPNL